MRILRSNSKTSIIALILMLTIATILVALPSVTAQGSTRVSTKQSYPYLGAIPNPAGVNQPVLLHLGITDQLETTKDGYENLTVSVIDPDGEESTIGPRRTDSTGGTGATFTPTKVGTYILQARFPAQWYNFTGFNMFFGFIDKATYYKEGVSEPLELVVQEEAIIYYPGHSLPEEYWSRPVDAQLREWSTIAGNWLISGWDQPFNKLAPYNDGPETAHILWRKKLTTGGLVGGELGNQAYECGDAYEGFYDGSVIIGGVLYYNRYKAGYPTQEVVAVDLHTGEELWIKVLGNNERIAFGQNFYWDSYNYHGTFDYIWTTVGTTWNAYDAYTGVYVYSIENVPSGTMIYGPKGEIYIYTVDLTNGWMTLWNSSSSRLVIDEGSWLFMMGMQGSGTYDAQLGIEWNKTIPTGLAGSVLVTLEDRIIGGTTDSFAGVAGGPTMQLWGLNLKTGHEGELLFNTTWSRPSGNLTMVYKGASLQEGIFIISEKETTYHHAFDIDTGKLVWSTSESQYYLDSLDYWTSASMHTVLAYGKFISVGSGGIVYAYDAETGDLEWTYEAEDSYQEILWSNNWNLLIAFITDGKIYLTHTEHSPIDPKPRGAPFICLNTEDGSVVWRIDGAFRGAYWGGRAIIGDSIIATYNTYDQQIYAIGKGASATTVTAPDIAQSLDMPILIQGTVMDVSPGTKDTALQLRFPNGVPAISDEDISEWMKYVYMQFKKPEEATGVEVVFNWVDSDGTWHDLDRTKTDVSGQFSYVWTPPAEGKYTIVATFMGSEGYYASSARTAIVVGPATEKAPSAEEIADTTVGRLPAYPTSSEIAQETVTQLPAYLTIDLVILIVAAVGVVIGLIAYMALRKQK
jgi:outer membrane protein assembly factor BamB